MSLKSCVVLAALGLSAMSLSGCVTEDPRFGDGYGRDHGRFERGRGDWRRDDGRPDRGRGDDWDARRDDRGDREERGRDRHRRDDDDDGDRGEDGGHRPIWPPADARY